jgi:hypothetical protein
MKGAVILTSEKTGQGLRLELERGTIVLHRDREEVYQEIATLNGFEDGRWMRWRPREDSFEDLV